MAIFGRTAGFGFVAYDDNKYVYENPVVRAGLKGANVAWAFKTFYFANWSPLTWLSYMTDVQLFGVNAGEMHAVNVLLHAMTAVLLFLALVRLTQQVWPCALLAGLFALHPLHVESVAWIADRKDVLSAFFAALTLFLYAGYAKAPSVLRYFAVALAFALSLMAKTMAVTLPFVLLLLDFWPLRRWGRRAVLEKVPLIAMAAVAGVLTYFAQRDAAEVVAVVDLEYLPFFARIASAAVTYVSYLGKAIWPANLAVFYPPHPPGAASALIALAILLAITAAAVRWVRRCPFLLVGWLCYLGMLLPTVGIVQQVAEQVEADRYVYLPLVGLFIAAIWTAASVLEKRPRWQRGATVCCVVWLAALAVAASRQTTYWANSRTLFEHGLAVTKGNYILAENLGVVLERKDGPSDESAALFRQAIAFKPSHAAAHASLGLELMRSGRLEEAKSELEEAVRLNPRSAVAQADLGVMFATEGNYEEGRRRLEESLRLDPLQPEALNNTCVILLRLGRAEDAAADCTQALKIRPEYTMARVNLARALAFQGRTSDAERELNAAMRDEPANATARQALDDLRAGRLR